MTRKAKRWRCQCHAAEPAANALAADQGQQVKRQLRRCCDGGLLFAGQPARSAEAPGHLHAAGSPTHLIDFALHHGLHGGVFHHLSQHSPVTATDDQHLGEERTENQPSAGAAQGELSRLGLKTAA